jgi:ABC-2 type transport system ATP-binding protein
MPDLAIVARSLGVRYGALEALADVDLEVHGGEVMALLGPNGAGKSTCVETLLGYRRPDAGIVEVLGLNPVDEHRRLVPKVGAMLQQPGIWTSLSPSRAIRLVASYYAAPEDPDELLDRLDLRRCEATPVRRLSGGEQQRLSLALALLPRPRALFLDEPTSGVDPVGRRVIREVVNEAKARGTAVLLCTHDLSDVEAVCDTATVLAGGRVRAAGTMAALTAGGTSFASVRGLDLEALRAATGLEVTEAHPGSYRCEVTLDARQTAALTSWLASRGAVLSELRQGTTLESKYVELVGATPDDAGTDAVTTPRRHRRR